MKQKGAAIAGVLILLLGFAVQLGAGDAATAPTTSSTSAAIVAIHGQIDDFSRNALLKHFDAAKSAGAHTIILDIDTYGGLVTAALDMSRYLKRQDSVHTIALIDDKAMSAGAMIGMACDEIVMIPGSVLGDCAPIAVSEESGHMEPLPAAERAKMESPILADFYDSAVRNHRDTLLAQSMVATDRSVHYIVRGME